MAIDHKKIENFLKHPVAVCVFNEIDSTNNEAKRRAEADRSYPALYVTDCQTAGRGRRGHDFYSPKGSGVYFTLALPLSAEPADVQVITCAAAVAVCEAIESLTEKHPQIKWVNDIYLDGRKVAGILTELLSDDQNRPATVIVGVGINLTTDHFPAEFAARAGSIGDIDPNRLCAEVSDRLIAVYTVINNSNQELKSEYNSLNELKLHNNSDQELKSSFNSIIEIYKHLNFCIGKRIQYTDAEGIHTAEAIDIAPDGSLIVEEDGVRKQLHSGEISVVPTA